MDAKTRILTGRLIEKMREQKAYCERLGLSDTSLFHGQAEQKRTDSTADTDKEVAVNE